MALHGPNLAPRQPQHGPSRPHKPHLGTEVGFDFDRKLRILPCCLAVLGIILPCGCKLYAFHMPPTSPNKAPTWPKHCPHTANMAQPGPPWPNIAPTCQHAPKMSLSGVNPKVWRCLAIAGLCKSLQHRRSAAASAADLPQNPPAWWCFHVFRVSKARVTWI